jgi:hypothetical protein
MFGLFRLPPFAYFLLAPLAIAFGLYMYFDDRKSEAEKAVALSAQPPELVKIEAFDPAKNTGVAREVNIVGQVDMSQMMEVTQSKRGNVRERWVLAPIYPTTATDTSAPAVGVIVQRGGATDDQLMRLIVGDGAFGPLMEIDGVSIDPSTERSALEMVSDKYRVTSNAIYIDPFEAGRAAGLGASSTGRQASISIAILGVLIGLYGVGRMFFLRRREEEEEVY